jgi:hypothetical protein
VVAGKEVCELAKAGVAVRTDIGWEARQVEVAMKRGERCDTRTDLLGVYPGRHTAARAEKIPVPGIEGRLEKRKRGLVRESEY